MKEEMAEITNPDKVSGGLGDTLHGADVFIGVSVPGVLTGGMISHMKEQPIIFAMANPIPEIMPEEAFEAGAEIIATGRSDFPNQINNVLAFPGLFRGALNARTHDITYPMYVATAYAIAECVDEPSPREIIPSAFDKKVAPKVAETVEEVCREERVRNAG